MSDFKKEYHELKKWIPNDNGKFASTKYVDDGAMGYIKTELQPYHPDPRNPGEAIGIAKRLPINFSSTERPYLKVELTDGWSRGAQRIVNNLKFYVKDLSPTNIVLLGSISNLKKMLVAECTGECTASGLGWIMKKYEVREISLDGIRMFESHIYWQQNGKLITTRWTWRD